jgi:cytochrome b561
VQYKIQELPGASSVEHILGNIGHYSLYAFMTIMPASGIAMGYYGGNEKFHVYMICYSFRLFFQQLHFPSLTPGVMSIHRI